MDVAKRFADHQFFHRWYEASGAQFLESGGVQCSGAVVTGPRHC